MSFDLFIVYALMSVRYGYGMVVMKFYDHRILCSKESTIKGRIMNKKIKFYMKTNFKIFYTMIPEKKKAKTTNSQLQKSTIEARM